MSSNIKAKNLIYSFSKYDELPYQKAENVNYDVKNTFINMVALNNTYGQCVDNDMYVAKTLIGKLTGSSSVGPKLVIDQNELDNLPDGAKFFSTAGSSSIMQKHVNSFQQSIMKYTNAGFNSLKFIHSIGAQTALLCTNSNTYVISVNDIGRDGSVSNMLEIKSESDSSFIVTAVLQYGDKAKTLFAGRQSTGERHGLYLLEVGGSNGSGYQFKLLHELEETDEICAIASDESSPKVIFATGTTLYSCDAYAEEVDNVQNIATFGDTSESGTICALIAQHSNAIVFTSLGKIYGASYSQSYTGFISSRLQQLSQNSITIHEVKTAANGVPYAATDAGLYVLMNNSMHAVDDNYTGDVKHIYVDSTGQVWCGDMNGNVLKSTGPYEMHQYAYIQSCKITDFKVIDGVNVLVTQNNGIMYESSPGVFSTVDGSSSMYFIQMVTEFSNDQTDAYIVGSVNSTLSAAYVKFNGLNSDQARLQVQHSKHSTSIYPSIQSFVRCAVNNNYAYLLNDSKLYLLNMVEDGTIGSQQIEIDFAEAFQDTGLVVKVDAAFANSMFGSDVYSYANVTLESGQQFPVAFKEVFTGNQRFASFMALDTSSEIELKFSQSSIGQLQHDAGVYTLYGNSVQYGTYYVQYTAVGDVNAISQSLLSLNDNDCVDGIIKLENGYEYALQTQTGIYVVKVSGNIQECTKTYTSTNVGSLAVYEDESQYIYCTSTGNRVLSSNDLSNWSQIVTVGLSASSPKIDSFLLLNPYIFLAGKTSGSDTGLYYTHYSYYVDNNIQPFTAESAYYAYYDNEDNIDNINASCLSDHINQNHLALNSDMDLINSCMDTKFSLSGFIKASSSTDVSNDYIDCILTGSSYDDNILVHVCNSVSNYRWNQLTCTYIAKCWKSGFTELYMYLPTTTTYYIPHIEGASQCNGYDEEVTVKGRSLMSNIKDNVTSVRVNIVSSFFTVDTLAENTIKANSLPLRVFKDDTYEDSCAGSMYHSFICPSVARDFSQSDTVLGYYSFHYYCFGSDAQAIKLSFFNSKPDYGRKYKTITYYANGGQLTKLQGMKKITQRIYEGEDPVNLYWDIFDKEGSFFIGWSKSAGASNEDEAYSQDTVVSYDSLKLRQLVLHACWLTYKFGANDTSITIANSLPSDYTIAEITIDPNATIPNNPKLGSRLIVDFGD